jgi:hypothetical protein
LKNVGAVFAGVIAWASRSSSWKVIATKTTISHKKFRTLERGISVLPSRFALWRTSLLVDQQVGQRFCKIIEGKMMGQISDRWIGREKAHDAQKLEYFNRGSRGWKRIFQWFENDREQTNNDLEGSLPASGCSFLLQITG